MSKRNRCWTAVAETLEPEQLVLKESALPRPVGKEVLVKHMAVPLNPVDWKVIGSEVFNLALPHVIGVDAVGVVVESGDQASVSKGSLVAFHQDIFQSGTFSQYSCVDSQVLFEVPPECNAAEVASLLCPGLTAWQAMEKLPRLAQAIILVNGAGGYVGELVVGMALLRGYRVIAIADTEHHVRLNTMGVEACFNYKDADWRAELSRYLGDKRVFAAVDTVGARSAASLYPFIRYNGHLVMIQDRLEHNPFPGFDKAISLHEVALNAVHKHLDEAELSSLRIGFRYLVSNFSSIARRRVELISFDEIPLALTDLKAGRVSGKYVAELL